MTVASITHYRDTILNNTLFFACPVHAITKTITRSAFMKTLINGMGVAASTISIVRLPVASMVSVRATKSCLSMQDITQRSLWTEGIEDGRDGEGGE